MKLFFFFFFNQYWHELTVSKDKGNFMHFFWKTLHLFGKFSIYFGNSQV